MTRNVLLLNASGEPLCFIPWTRALVLIIKKKAEAYEYFENMEVHSQSQTYRVPSVVGLLRYVVLTGGRQVPLNKKNLLIRDDSTCQYCGRHVTVERATVDHVMPAARGGKTSWENCVVSCKPCNGKKACRTPEDADMALLRKPWVPTRKLLIRRTAAQLGMLPLIAQYLG